MIFNNILKMHKKTKKKLKNIKRKREMTQKINQPDRPIVTLE